MTIYVYDEPYIRFSAEDYNPNNINNLFSHLTNNSIGKNSDLFDNSEIKGNMWDTAMLSQFLKVFIFIEKIYLFYKIISFYTTIFFFENFLFFQDKFLHDIFTEKIKPKINEIIIYSLGPLLKYTAIICGDDAADY